VAEFTPITTQEELDKVLADYKASLTTDFEKQIAQVQEQTKNEVQASYKAWSNPETVEKLKAELATVQQDNKNLKFQRQKHQIAREFNIPYELAERLQGETEDELKADAQSLQSFIGKSNDTPTASTETREDSKTSYLKKMLQDLKGV